MILIQSQVPPKPAVSVVPAVRAAPAIPLYTVGAGYSAAAAEQHVRWTQHPTERLVAADVCDSTVRAARSAQVKELLECPMIPCFRRRMYSSGKHL